ncbi:SWIM zinc finger family protein [Brachybacterium sp. YJGR34]|uniref:SWIM zinc finger family protein n=1 Tax=Brachybacterium sp. YJGR34 TaxID=2059911 RepID=UPI000E0A370F|nr:SWIM zinc finger family protein [Brachybacterium sp. YJGR34]
MSITLRSRRGPIGVAWHAVALREAAEALLGTGRAGGGRADARAGRVQWLDVAAGLARGDVLDADGALYHARLELPVLRADERRDLLRVAHAHPELPARLASGEYPRDVETELARSALSLLPREASELTHDCSCLDWPGPCRHVAALVYVLVEAVDAEPVLLLQLRGLALEDLVAPPAETEDAAPRSEAFDATLTNPDLLAEVIGDGPAGIIASFYGSRGAPTGTPEPPTPQ